MHFKVAVTGIGTFTGTAVSAASGPIPNMVQLAPVGLVGVGPTSYGGSDGKIMGTTVEMEYKLSSESDYQTAGAGETAGLAAGIYHVRYSVRSGYDVGFVEPVNVPEYERTQLTVAAPTLTKSKAYDGDTSAVVVAGTLEGVVPSDDVTVSAVATYDSKDAGTGKTITVVYTLGGTNAANYIKPVDGTYADGEITPKQLTVGAPDLTRAYDGNSVATVTAGALTGVVPPDVVTVSAVAVYDSKDAGTGKSVVVMYTLGGADAANYIKPVDGVFTDGEITPKQLTVGAPTLTKSKVYDGDTSAVVVAGTLEGVVPSDDVTVSAVATYDSKDVGTGKTITVVYTLGGADEANYIKPVDGTYTDGEITSKQLTVAAPTLTKSKAYDGNTDAVVVAGALTGVVPPDDVTVSAVATYDSKDAGTGKTITVVYTLGGTNAANYIKPVDGTYADGEITPKQLTVGAPDLTRAYDGNLIATVTAGDLEGVVPPDVVTVSAVATYDSKDVGSDKSVVVVYTLGGADAANYDKPGDGTYTDGEITGLSLTASGPAGGLVFYENPNWETDGWRYLEAATSRWYNNTLYDPNFIFGHYQPDGVTNTTMGTTTGIGTGEANTLALVSAMGSTAYKNTNPGGETTAEYAAKICADYAGGGYEDWFLPSKDELNEMYLNLKAPGVGNFSVYEGYWSSSEDYLTDPSQAIRYAWALYISGDSAVYYPGTYRTMALKVRPVRAF